MGIDQVGVLSEPAEPRAPRQVALQNRTGVHVRLAVNRATHLRLEPTMKLVQPLDHHVVIIVSARVTGDRPGRLAPTVAQSNHDCVSGSGVRQAGIPTLLGAA